MESSFVLRVEDWLPEYGQANRIADGDLDRPEALLVEDADQPAWLSHAGADRNGGWPALAFVDGVRRTEGFLHASEPSAQREFRGLAGSFARGAVLGLPGERPQFAGHRVERMAIWGSSPGVRAGDLPELPELAGGWRWASHAIADEEIHKLLHELERRMRRAEGQLADELANKGFVVIVDGPLEFVTRQHGTVVGYIKSHHRPLLARPDHLRVPDLAVGCRTSLFAIREDLLSAYVRVGSPSVVGSPWAGIARIEVPRALTLECAIDLADRVTGMLPQFAGIAHRDPRAPQNLQPVGALEAFLRRLLGSSALARRATRDALAARNGT